MKQYDVTAFGEVLIDFTFTGINTEGKKSYEENPGGAPANCAATVSKLGGKAAFIGMTGQDFFGNDICQTLKDLNVDISGIRQTDKHHTTLAFVSLDQKGERCFSFCRNPGADTQITIEDLDTELLKVTTFLHVGSLSLTNEPSKSTQMEAIRIVKESGGFVSYDPNWRPSLWQGRSDSLELINTVFKLADLIKISEEELSFFFGNKCSPEEGAANLLSLGAKLVLVTLGEKGAYYSANTEKLTCNGFVDVSSVKVVDTTGAGDSFTGSLLYAMTRRKNPFDFSQAQIESEINLANVVAALCVTRRGAIPALPTLKEATEFIAKYNAKF